MTILVAVKTGTDLIIAADSKVTTSGIGGKDADGNPIWLNQTYDFGTKIAFSENNYWTGAITGQSSFGDVQVSDIVGQYVSGRFNARADQELDLMELVNNITKIRNIKFKTFSDGYWPFTSLLLFSSDPEGRGVRAWRIVFNSGPAFPSVNEILNYPSVYFDGSYTEVFTLLYGYNIEATKEIAAALDVPEDDVNISLRQKYLSPISKLNLVAMPIQDAMDLAVFLAKVQIQMERFLPGTPRCGGPIDIAVVRGLPKHEIIWYPGKELRHPGSL